MRVVMKEVWPCVSLLRLQKLRCHTLSITSPMIRPWTRPSSGIVHFWHPEGQLPTVWSKIAYWSDLYSLSMLLTLIRVKSTRTRAQPYCSFHRKSSYLRILWFLRPLLKILWNHTERPHHIWHNITILQSPDLPKEGSTRLTQQH